MFTASCNRGFQTHYLQGFYATPALALSAAIRRFGSSHRDDIAVFQRDEDPEPEPKDIITGTPASPTEGYAERRAAYGNYYWCDRYEKLYGTKP